MSSLTGKDAVLEADTAEFLAWLRARGLPEQGQLDVAQMDRRLQGFQRTVLRYGVVKALLEKGYPVPRDAALWAVFDAAMRLRLPRAPGPDR